MDNKRLRRARLLGYHADNVARYLSFRAGVLKFNLQSMDVAMAAILEQEVAGGRKGAEWSHSQGGLPMDGTALRAWAGAARVYYLEKAPVEAVLAALPWDRTAFASPAEGRLALSSAGLPVSAADCRPRS